MTLESDAADPPDQGRFAFRCSVRTCYSPIMLRKELVDEETTGAVIGVFFEVYNTLGYGFLQHVYIAAMERELRDRGHSVGREVGVNVYYKGVVVASQRLDMVVDEKVVVEIKSTSQLAPTAPRQLYNYLKATNLQVGLLLHFGPEPKFHRQLSPKKERPLPTRDAGVDSTIPTAPDPANPANPLQTS